MARARRAAKVTPVRQLSTKPPLRRLYWALARLRSSKPLKATDLAAEFEVNVRTAYRDLDFLRDQWRVPLEFDRSQGTYLLTEPMAELPAVTVPAVAGGWSAMLRIPTVIDEEELALDLLERRGVAIHPGYFFDFPGPGWLVVSLLPEPHVFAAGAAVLLEELDRRVREL